MKRILTLLLFIGSIHFANAQIFIKPNPYGYGSDWTRGMFDLTLYIPTQNGQPLNDTALNDFTVKDRSALLFDTIGHKLYCWDPSTMTWSQMGGGSGITPSNTPNQYLNGYNLFTSLMTDSITEGVNNLWFTLTRSRTAISITTSGTSGPVTYDNTTGIFNFPVIDSFHYITPYQLSLDSIAFSNFTISGVKLNNNLFGLTPSWGIIGGYYDGSLLQTWKIDTSKLAPLDALKDTAAALRTAIGSGGSHSDTTIRSNIIPNFSVGCLIWNGSSLVWAFPGLVQVLGANNNAGGLSIINLSLDASLNTIINIPNSSLVNSTISGISLGGVLYQLTPGYGLIGMAYNGSNAYTWNIDTSLNKIATRYSLYYDSLILASATNAGLSLKRNIADTTGNAGFTTTRYQRYIDSLLFSTDITNSGVIATNNTGYYLNAFKVFTRLNTDSILQGSTNLFFSQTLARASFSITTTHKAGTPTYNSSTGVFDLLQVDTTSTLETIYAASQLTISGIKVGNNLFSLTLGSGLIGTSYNGSSAITAYVDSTLYATKTYAQSLVVTNYWNLSGNSLSINDSTKFLGSINRSIVYLGENGKIAGRIDTLRNFIIGNTGFNPTTTGDTSDILMFGKTIMFSNNTTEITSNGTGGQFQFGNPGGTIFSFTLTGGHTNTFTSFATVNGTYNFPSNIGTLLTQVNGHTGAVTGNALLQFTNGDVVSKSAGSDTLNLSLNATQTQINAIASPRLGQLKFNTTIGAWVTYNGSVWILTSHINGSYSGSGTATTSFTVTLPITMPNSTYNPVITPTDINAVTGWYISAETTTSFTITYTTAITGAVTFNYTLN